VAIFENLDYRRLDVMALTETGGLATINPEAQESCIQWLVANRYEVVTVDGSEGLASLAAQLGEALDWKSQFGYSVIDEVNLDALNDGFEFDVPVEGGLVLQFLGAEKVWSEDQKWCTGMLSIASAYSRAQLALGRRFFTLLVLSPDSQLHGAAVDTVIVPLWFQFEGTYEQGSAIQG